jgi:hypothetical protein
MRGKPRLWLATKEESPGRAEECSAETGAPRNAPFLVPSRHPPPEPDRAEEGVYRDRIYKHAAALRIGLT